MTDPFATPDPVFQENQIKHAISNFDTKEDKLQMMMQMFFPDTSYPRPLIAKYCSQIQKGKI